MKKFKFCILAGLLALLSVSAFAEGRLPANIQTAFQTLYPQATDVEWEQMAGCYVAEFIADGQEIDVWFNKQAEWVMTETDVESLEKVPAPVAEAFMSSTMRIPTVLCSGWKTITKPRCNRTWRRDLSRTLFQ